MKRFWENTLHYLSLMICAATTVAIAGDVLRKDFVGTTPPEIVAAKQEWLGKSTPAQLSSLKGHVVWLQFNF